MSGGIVVLASGAGSTAEAYIRASQVGRISSPVKLVIVNRPNAGIFERIAKLNKELGLSIDTQLINHLTHPPEPHEQLARGYQSKAEEGAILESVNTAECDLVALMGYMKKIGPNLVYELGWRPEYASVFQAKMVNTHPGLLPDTKGFYGLNIQKYVLDRNLPYSGQSLHVVSEEYDSGPIIAEHKVMVEPGDSAENLFARVQTTEKQYLPEDIQTFIDARRAYIT
jgi:phosphoribosylglycinamide formyltransferase-1